MSGTALITGASSGIGESFARMLATRGKNLLLVARSGYRLGDLAGELHAAHGVDVDHVPLDLAEPNGCRSLLDEIRRRRLQVELLVNNAGFAAQGEFWKLPADELRRMLVLHMESVIALTHALVPPMIDAGRGGVINVSSVTSFQAIPYASVYSASKAFLTSFSMALQEELKPYKIAVVTLCPGGTRTNLRILGRRGEGGFPGRPQEPAEVVRAALDRLERGGGLVVPRFRNKFMVAVQRILPRETVAGIAGKMARRSVKPD